jgi:hypothetical protein
MIEANTNLTNLQSDAFLFRASISGTISAPFGVHRDSRQQGLSGVTVQLENQSGSVLATALTDRQGHYRFDNFSGIAGTGTYNVRLSLPSGDTQASANPAAIAISRGDVNISGVNFTVATAQSGKSNGGGHALSPSDASGSELASEQAVFDVWFAATYGRPDRHSGR